MCVVVVCCVLLLAVVVDHCSSLVVGCYLWLHDVCIVGCWPRVVCCLLLLLCCVVVCCCWLFVARCVLLVVVVGCRLMSFGAYCELFDGCCLLFCVR